MKVRVTRISNQNTVNNNKASDHKDDKKPLFEEQLQKAIQKEKSKR